MKKYKGMTAAQVKELFLIGKANSDNRNFEMDAIDIAESKFGDFNAYEQEAYKVLLCGAANRNVSLEEKTYYHIGALEEDEYFSLYRPSYNYADDRFEEGVSVVTLKWLHSIKSIFWGAEERIKSWGVYKFKGVQIGFGGDDEPVVYPTSLAEKTAIKSLEEMEAVLGKAL